MKELANILLLTGWGMILKRHTQNNFKGICSSYMQTRQGHKSMKDCHFVCVEKNIFWLTNETDFMTPFFDPKILHGVIVVRDGWMWGPK